MGLFDRLKKKDSHHGKQKESTPSQPHPPGKSPSSHDPAAAQAGPNKSPHSSVSKRDVAAGTEKKDLETSPPRGAEKKEEENELPTNVAQAIDKLNKSAEKLKDSLPKTMIQESATFKVDGGADINALADNVGSTLVALMSAQDSKSKQKAQSLLVEWAKKAIPFIQPGLSVASVSPYFKFP
jgi:hypothetical protein